MYLSLCVYISVCTHMCIYAYAFIRICTYIYTTYLYIHIYICNAANHVGKVAATSTFLAKWGCCFCQCERVGDATSTLELWHATPALELWDTNSTFLTVRNYMYIDGCYEYNYIHVYASPYKAKQKDCAYIHIWVYIHICLQIYIYTYIYTYIYGHTYIYIVLRDI